MRDAGGSLVRRLRLAARGVVGWRFTWRWLRDVVRSFAVSFAALAVTLWILPGPQVPERGLETVATLVLAVLLVGAVLRPFVTRLTALTGVVGLLLAGLLTQTLVLGIALSFVPAVEPIALPELVFTTWCAAVVATVLNWVVDASSEEVFLGQVLGQVVRTARRTDVAGPGLLVVQLDGVAAPLLRQAAAAGTMPWLTGEVRAGRMRLREWHTGLPSTTPAGQAVLMHGDAAAVPGFRWYDRGRRRVLECSRPADAAVVEADLTTGRGLLADGGASVSNLFSGDAPLRALTMSHARLPGSEPGAAQFASARSGFVRSMVLLAGQVVTEWYQARRQVRRDVVPRVHRGGAFLFLRGLTTVVLRDLTVSIVAEQMARGVPVVYVDLVDYDEVAHHAGPTRPESTRTLEGLDRALRFLAVEVAAEVGRRYEVVVVSDHGQSQGRPFRQLQGRTLAEAVRDAVGGPVEDHDDEPEAMGPANVLLGTRARTARALRVVLRRGSGRPDDADGPARRVEEVEEEVDDPAASVRSPSGAVRVLASGSLAHLYLPDPPGTDPARTDPPHPGTGAAGRASREEVERRLPGLLAALRALEHVGLVLTRTPEGLLCAEDREGRRFLDPTSARLLDHGAEGPNPLEPFGRGAATALAGLDGKPHVGDVVVLGRYDPDLGEVAAFEELVGSHGGLGGWQTRAALVHPAGWTVPRRDLVGRDVHTVLEGRLRHLGLRGPDDADDPADPDAPEPADAAEPVERPAPATVGP